MKCWDWNTWRRHSSPEPGFRHQQGEIDLFMIEDFIQIKCLYLMMSSLIKSSVLESVYSKKTQKNVLIDTLAVYQTQAE